MFSNSYLSPDINSNISGGLIMSGDITITFLPGKDHPAPSDESSEIEGIIQRAEH